MLLNCTLGSDIKVDKSRNIYYTLQKYILQAIKSTHHYLHCMYGWRQVCSCWWQDFAAAVTIWLAWRTLQFVTCKAMTVILLYIHHYSISQYQLRSTCRDFHKHLLFKPHVAFINSRSALSSLDSTPSKAILSVKTWSSYQCNLKAPPRRCS